MDDELAHFAVIRAMMIVVEILIWRISPIKTLS